MNHSNFCFLVVILLTSKLVYSQSLQINEGLKNRNIEKKKTKFIFQFDNRRSFVFDQPTRFSGYRIGLQYKEVHDIGLGFYETRSPVRTDYKQDIINHKAETKAEFEYNTIFYQYTFYGKKKWELAIPIHLGSGNATIQVVEKDSDILILKENGIPELDKKNLSFSISEIGFDGQYKFYNWLGIGTGLGYRFLLIGDKEQRNLFDGVTYSFKLKIFLGEVVKSINNYTSYEQVYSRRKK